MHLSHLPNIPRSYISIRRPHFDLLLPSHRRRRSNDVGRNTPRNQRLRFEEEGLGREEGRRGRDYRSLWLELVDAEAKDLVREVGRDAGGLAVFVRGELWRRGVLLDECRGKFPCQSIYFLELLIPSVLLFPYRFIIVASSGAPFAGDRQLVLALQLLSRPLHRRRDDLDDGRSFEASWSEGFSSCSGVPVWRRCVLIFLSVHDSVADDHLWFGRVVNSPRESPRRRWNVSVEEWSRLLSVEPRDG